MQINLINLNFIFFFVLVTISSAVTTSESYTFVTLIRYVLAAMIVASLVLIKKGMHSGFYLIAYLLVTYLLSIVLLNNDDSYLFNFLILIIGLFSSYGFLSNFTLERERFFIRFLHFYFYFVMALTFISGGLNFDLGLSLNFSYGSMQIGREESYSLGVSNLFGLFSVIFFYEILKNRNNNIFYLIAFFGSLYMTILGGGRGEFLISLFMLAMMLFFLKAPMNRKLFIYFALSLLLFYILFNIDLDLLLESIVLFQRLGELSLNNLGSRDDLLSQSLELLRDNPHCLVLGCGIGFFQNYYQYSLSTYPHNSIAEFVISYGLIALIFVFAFCLRGMRFHVKKFKGTSSILLVFLYQFFISLKSGDLLSSYLLLVLLLSLFAYGFKRRLN